MKFEMTGGAKDWIGSRKFSVLHSYLLTRLRIQEKEKTFNDRIKRKNF